MLHLYVEPALRAALQRLDAPEETPLIWEVPKQEGQGHLSSTVAMSLARPLKKAPKQIAEAIIAGMGSVPHVEKVEVAGPGFINITFAPSAYQESLRTLLEQGDAIGRSEMGAGKTVNVEYVSANPTGLLHPGHGRNSAVGDTIANLYAWTGHAVTREYYFNNAGNQMNNLGRSIYARYRQELGETDYPFPEDGYHGEYPRSIARELVAMIGDRYKEESQEALDHCRKTGEQWCFAAIQRTLDALHIAHDTYFNEDSLYTDGSVNQTVEDLRAKGLVYEHEGATWLKLTELGQPQDKVIIKSTGEPTYRLPDIAYHRNKLSRGYDYVVDIFGADHIATIPDVLAACGALGYDTSRVKVVIHQMVTFMENGEVVKLSKRSGRALTLDDLIEEVGADVVRFFFVMRSVSTHLEFDLGLAKEEGDKNPVFYLQYAHARISSILRKGLERGIVVEPTADLSPLTSEPERALIALLTRMRSVVEKATENLEPHTVADYLRDVAAAFHTFYHECRILGEAPEVERARLVLCDVTRRAMRNGLTILGVSAPEQM